MTSSTPIPVSRTSVICVARRVISLWFATKPQDTGTKNEYNKYHGNDDAN